METWSSALLIIGIVSLVLGVFAAVQGSIEVLIMLIVGGILFMASSSLLAGLSVIVRKALNDLVEDGDDKYLLYEQGEEVTN
jgi:hypothetical protein